MVECVANVSEGRNLVTLDRMSTAIRQIPGCLLLHRDVGHDAHRSVFTFAGSGEAVAHAALALSSFSRAARPSMSGSAPCRGGAQREAEDSSRAVLLRRIGSSLVRQNVTSRNGGVAGTERASTAGNARGDGENIRDRGSATVLLTPGMCTSWSTGVRPQTIPLASSAISAITRFKLGDGEESLAMAERLP